jgi:transmembrane sensor
VRPFDGRGMAREPESADRQAPVRASEWLVALSERPDDSLLRAHFERWLAASPDHQRDWDEISRTADVLGHVPPIHHRKWGEFVRRRKAMRAATPSASPGGVAGRRRWLPAGAVALAAAACLALFFLGGNLLLRLEADHATATAELHSVRLADGTMVLLGPESAIGVDYSATARRVRLLKGKAYFEVGADGRPFFVEAREVEARDIGTAFDVRLGTSATDIAVREGIVDVSTPRQTTVERLMAGDWLRVLPAGGIERGRVAADQVASWTQGQLVVKNRPVAEVVDALRPYFDGVVMVRGTTLAAQPLTGVYNLADPVEALRAVARAQGAALHRLSPWVIVISGD